MNRVITGSLILLLFLVVGELVNRFIFTLIPASIVGMLLLFVALRLKLVKEQWVGGVVDVLMSNLSLFFLAPAVGIIVILSDIKSDIVVILLAIVVSTMLTLLAVGLSVDGLIRRRDGRDIK